jgi:hypothetical protein
MSRPTTILALVQTTVVIVGFVGLGIMLKGCGYPDGQRIGVQWSPLAVFLREHGIWLLLVPVLWGAYAVSAQRKNSGLLSCRAALAVGICLAACLLAAFLHATLNPYTLPVLLHVR